MTRRRLSDEESDLWNRVTRTIRSAKPARREIGAGPKTDSVRPVQSTKPATGVRSMAPPRANEKNSHDAQIVTNSATAAPRTPPPPGLFAAGDPRRVRHIEKGRQPIDAVLDLHGYRQHEARDALRDFVRTSYLAGFTGLLIVTGKGSAGLGSAPSGVLRKRVPDWLHEAEIRAMIARISQAHQRHGGAGALYIVLKSRHRTVRR